MHIEQGQDGIQCHNISSFKMPYHIKTPPKLSVNQKLKCGTKILTDYDKGQSKSR